MRLSKVYKAKTREEAIKLCPKGYRLPEIWELVKLACEGNKKIFDTEKGSWIFFWGKTHRLCRDIYGCWGADLGSPFYSDADGRVVFVKDLKPSSKTGREVKK